MNIHEPPGADSSLDDTLRNLAAIYTAHNRRPDRISDASAAVWPVLTIRVDEDPADERIHP